MRLAVTSIALVSLALGAQAAQTIGGADPYEMVRTLNALQSRMSRGDDSARLSASKQLDRIEQTLASVEPEAWKNPKNTRAAVIYLLSGGSPATIRTLLDAGFFSEEDKVLVSGSLAYAEGRSREAAKILQPIDARKYSPTLGGHLALVQGGLLMGSNSTRAQSLFDLARLLMPGSLVEEAALRREISTISNSQELEKLLLLGRRYAAEYSGSPYVQNYWDELGAAMVRTALKLDEAQLNELEELFQNMNSARKFDLYLLIARKAILNARIALAASHTKKAEPLAQTGSARMRLKFYNTVIGAISGQLEHGVAEIQTIDSKSLPKADLEMGAIVIATMNRLDASSNEEGLKLETVLVRADQDAESAVTELPVEKSARQAIAEADALLERASK